MGLKEPGLRGSLRNVSVGIRAIPDDLTDYTLTDPDGRISVTSSDSYEARLADGSNDVSRLFTSYSIEDITLSFDVEVLSASNGAQSVIGWSTTEDATLSSMSDFVGLKIYNSDSSETNPENGFKAVNSTDVGIIGVEGFAEYSINTTYTIEFNINGNELTITVSDSEGLVGSDTVSFDAELDWSHIYAQASADAGFSSPGDMDYDLSNWVNVD